MPRKRLSMRKIREVLRLAWGQGRSAREVAGSCGLARSSVKRYLRRAERAGLSWPLPEELDDGALEARLFPPLPRTAGVRPLPDWDEVDRELKRGKGVTLQLLWEEYRERFPNGYQYSRYCDHFRAWRKAQDVVMRQPHRAGEKLFVDYAGQRAQVVDPAAGEARQAEVFVAVLGASSYAYCEATWSQTLPDWIGAIRFNPAIKTFYQRLRAAGKHAKVALTACMRKLLLSLNAIAKTKQSWRLQAAPASTAHLGGLP